MLRTIYSLEVLLEGCFIEEAEEMNFYNRWFKTVEINRRPFFNDLILAVINESPMMIIECKKINKWVSTLVLD